MIAAKRGLALDQRRRAQIIAIQIEEIERVKDQPIGVPGGQCILQRGKIRRAAALSATTSPSMIASSTGRSARATARASPNFAVQSSPLRVSSLTRSDRICACSR